jgi:hypothetical protein
MSGCCWSCRRRCRLPAQLAAVRKQVEAMLPEAQVMDYREGNPALTQGLDRATSILSLICLVAMVLGAIGVAMSMHAHLEQRMDVLAILKAIGAGSGICCGFFCCRRWGWGWLERAGRGGGGGRDDGAAGGLWQPAAGACDAGFSVALGAGRAGDGVADDAAVLPAAAARCAEGAADSGAAAEWWSRRKARHSRTFSSAGGQRKLQIVWAAWSILVGAGGDCRGVERFGKVGSGLAWLWRRFWWCCCCFRRDFCGCCAGC